MPTPPPSPTPNRFALLGLALSMLLSSLGTSIANVALPTLVQELASSFGAVQWVVLAYLFAITGSLLVAEGMARELVNRIQNIRKTRDFNVTDRIQIDLEKHPAVEEAVAQFGQYISDEVLAVRLDLVAGVEGEVLDLPEEVVVKVRVELA